MSSRFDGPLVLAAIAGQPASFPALKTDIDATARKLLLKQIKAASLTFDILVRIVTAVGEGTFQIGLDEMSLKELAAVAHRLDPANASLAAMDDGQLRDHICALGCGGAKPLPGKKAAARAPAERPAKELSKIGEVLNSKVHSGEPVKSADAPTKPLRVKRGSGKSGA